MYPGRYYWRQIGVCVHCQARLWYNEDEDMYRWRPYNPECNCTTKEEEEEDDQAESSQEGS